jgi:hypothetical protein
MDATAVRSTGKALLCEIPSPGGIFTAWVPFSQLAAGSEVQQAGDTGTLVVSAWWFEVSRTDQQFRAQDLKASESKRSQPSRSSTRLEDIARLTEADFAEARSMPASPQGEEPARIEITDADVPF